MPKSIIPSKLSFGDQIRVIAPSTSALMIETKRLKLAISRTEIIGLNVSLSTHAFEKDMLQSSSIESRVADLHAAFLDKNVKGIACAMGGYNINTMLPHVDWNIIKKNPKPIWGYSDITVLLNSIYAKTGLVTYCGPTFSTFGKEDKKDDVQYIFDSFGSCLLAYGPYAIAPSNYFSERKVAPSKNKGHVVLQKGKAEGVTIGGNLCSLNLLQGTEYMPSLKDKVLFIEDDDFGGEYTPREFERNLESLLQLPSAGTIKGLVFGRFPKGADMNIEKLRFILASKKLPKNIPIIANVDFGHTSPMITFPIGGTVRIEAKGNVAKIEIMKH